MNKDRLIELLEDKLLHQEGLIKQFSDMLSIQSKQISIQTDTIKQLSNQVSTLQGCIESLEKALLEKDGDVEALTNKNRGLSKLIANKSEKQTVEKYGTTPPQQTKEIACLADVPSVEKPSRKTNNKAKRKEFYDLKTTYVNKYAEDIDFNLDQAKQVSVTESITYKCIPMSFEKVITRLHTHSYNGKIYAAKAPVKPFLNSNYDASFIAGILQLRYIYSMPVERIIKLFGENNFEINKPTAHALLRKAAGLLERFEHVIKNAVLEDQYIGMDESYHTVLVEKSKANHKGSVKGYIWCALAMTKNLLHFFYDKGARNKEVFLNYLPKDYQGAVSSDGLSIYKRLETDEYPNAIRLSCFQHCKRYFLEIEQDTDARCIIDLINKLYIEDHKIESTWSEKKQLQFREKYAPPLLTEIKSKLDEINNRPPKDNPPKSLLAKAVKHMLSEFNALSNYILRPEYRLDNNALERVMRYISLSRKNSLFAGSHEGAKRSALFYSLACSCRVNKVNTFEYFSDILYKMAIFPPNVGDEELRQLLPDKWNKCYK